MASVGNMYVPPPLLHQPPQQQNDGQGFEIGSLPGINRKKNQVYSLEQTRFLNRIKNASRRQNEMYKYQCNQNKAIEKVKYAKMLERAEVDSYKTGGYEGEMYNFRQPLGKVVTQVEMNNPEARMQLREMLEFQIKEKERLRQEDKSLREKIYPQSNILKD